MATGTWDPNVIVPVTSNTTIGTSAVNLKTSANLAVRFTLTNNGTKTIYVGDSNVAANRCTVQLTAGSNYTFDVVKTPRNRDVSWDLQRFWAIATAASQVLTLTTYGRGSSGTW